MNRVEIEGGKTPAFVRYVAYHPKFGVYLGDDRWSKVNPGNRDIAPTFPKGETPVVKLPPGVNDFGSFGIAMMETIPDYDDKDGNKTLASSAACAYSLLPSWTTQSDKDG
jgi:hypothetical protein